MATHLYTVDNANPPAVGQHPQPIILKVPETIGSPGDHFHLVVEALCDAVAFAESPHGDDNIVSFNGLSPNYLFLR